MKKTIEIYDYINKRIVESGRFATVSIPTSGMKMYRSHVPIKNTFDETIKLLYPDTFTPIEKSNPNFVSRDSDWLEHNPGIIERILEELEQYDIKLYYNHPYPDTNEIVFPSNGTGFMYYRFEINE